jgi:hypothetical protein
MTYFKSKHVAQLDTYNLLSNKNSCVENDILFISLTTQRNVTQTEMRNLAWSFAYGKYCGVVFT